MDAPARRSGSRPDVGPVVARFKPTHGLSTGWVGIGLACVTVVYVAVWEHSPGGLRVGLGAVFFAVLVWATQIRPRATAYADHLVLHGTVSDTVVPYAAVNQVTMGQTLNVWVGQKRYVCVGIGRSVGAEARRRVRSRGRGDLLGLDRASRALGVDETAAVPGSEQGTAYHAFVLDRITDLVTAARRQADAPRAEVSRHLAVAEVVALVLTGVAFLASLVL